jgi:hypothetical protein
MPQRNIGAQHQGVRPLSIAAAVISLPPAIRNEAQVPIKRERSQVVVGHFQKHRCDLFASGFGGGIGEQRTRQALSAHIGRRRDRKNLAFVRSGSNQGESLQLSLSLTAGHTPDHTRLAQKAAEKIFRPRLLLLKAEPMNACEGGGVPGSR